jgi:hypothetical protein
MLVCCINMLQTETVEAVKSQAIDHEHLLRSLTLNPGSFRSKLLTTKLKLLHTHGRKDTDSDVWCRFSVCRRVFKKCCSKVRQKVKFKPQALTMSFRQLFLRIQSLVSKELCICVGNGKLMHYQTSRASPHGRESDTIVRDVTLDDKFNLEASRSTTRSAAAHVCYWPSD